VSHAPRFVPRTLGSPGSLTRALLEGGSARELVPAGSLDPSADVATVAGSSRIGVDAVRGGTPELREELRAVLGGDGVLVTTGQQPVLFLGPLLVLYKAVTAITVAERLREEGTRAVPLFWVGGDDHDWDEVGTTRLLDRENVLRTLTLEPPPDRRGRAAGPTPLPEEIEDRIEEITQILPPSEFVEDYLELIREAYRPGRALGEAFGSTLQGVLEPLGIPWIASTDPALRRAAAPLYRRVITDADDARAALRRATRRVAEAGYEPQVSTAEGATPLFLDRPEGRTRLWEGEDLPREAVLAELEERPEGFSPDVSLRPLLASWLLPTGATVLGPSELAYWAQLPDLFTWADVPFPRLRPRDAWTVLEEKVEKVLAKLDADVSAFEDEGMELARRVREAGTPDAVEAALSSARAATGEAMDGVEEAVARELPGIRSAVGAARHGAFEVLDELEAAVAERVEERHQVLLGQIRKAAVHLFPDGRAQERVQSPLYYLARYGRGFVDALVGAAREAREGAAGSVAGPEARR